MEKQDNIICFFSTCKKIFVKIKQESIDTDFLVCYTFNVASLP